MSIAGINPLAFAEVWDVVTIDGVDSPGKCELVDLPKRKYDWDVKKGKGTIGGTDTFTSAGPITFAVKFYAWEEAHFDAWELFLPPLKVDPTKKDNSKAHDFYHPAAADLDLYSVVTGEIGAWEPVGEAAKGMWSRTIQFIEYFPVPPKPALATPAGSSGGWANAPPTAAKTAATAGDDVVKSSGGYP